MHIQNVCLFKSLINHKQKENGLFAILKPKKTTSAASFLAQYITLVAESRTIWRRVGPLIPYGCDLESLYCPLSSHPKFEAEVE